MQAFQALYQNEKLLNAIEQLVGPEIAAGTVWNTRPKAPRHTETVVPWHQGIVKTPNAATHLFSCRYLLLKSMRHFLLSKVKSKTTYRFTSLFKLKI